MKQKNDAGFSLVEVLVAIVILAAFVVPTCSALVMSAKMNAKTDALMQAQLDVSSAVETLMAKGVDQDFIGSLVNDDGDEYSTSTQVEFAGFNVLWKVEEVSGMNCYKVSVISKDGLVEVSTTVRARGGTS